MFVSNFFLRASNFFGNIKDSISQGLMIAICAASILCIIAVVFFVIRHLSKKQETGSIVPVIMVTVVACFFTIPATLSMTNLIKIGIRKELRNISQEELENIQLKVKNKQLEHTKLEQENQLMKQEIELNSLNKQVNLLKACQVSAMQFQKIAEIALIKTNIQQTKVWHQQDSAVHEGWGLQAEYYLDGVLVVNTYDIDAKFGIDFNKIKIKKISNDKIQVSGIKPTYIGASKNIRNTEIKELRRYNYKNKSIASIAILNKPTDVRKADTLADEFDKEYQESLQDMKNWSYLTDPIVTLGQNFVKLIFAPAYAEIIFTEEDTEDYLPLKEYIETEIQKNEKGAEELKDLLPTIIEAEMRQKEENSETAVQKDDQKNG